MNIPKIDIIVPVYKVEPYLRKCVDSLLNQTYDDYIISLVDDGSPDECPVICDEYAINYPEKIRVYHKQNGGLSDARNYAVERSKSEFVIFVDSDDWVSEHFIQNLVEGLTSSEIDMVVSPYYRATETSEGVSIRLSMPTKAPCCMGVEEALIELCREEYYGNHACSKLIKRSLILAYLYPIGKYFEDSYTTYKHIAHSRKVSYIPNPGYYYLQREGSIVRSEFQRRHLDLIYATQEMVEYMIDNDFSRRTISFGVYKLFRSAHATFIHARKESDFNVIYDEVLMILNRYKEYFSVIDQSLKETIIHNIMILNRPLYHFMILGKKK